jgi:heat shock protein HspQ
MATDFTKKMLQTIRENTEKIRNEKFQPLIVEETNAEEENFLSRSKILMEEAEKNFQKKKLERGKA